MNRRAQGLWPQTPCSFHLSITAYDPLLANGAPGAQDNQKCPKIITEWKCTVKVLCCDMKATGRSILYTNLYEK